MSENEAAPAVADLRRDVSIWGSYSWGYADVGADIYVALGLVIGAAQGAATLAFAIAGLVYILIGLALTELTLSYPVAGGGHYYALRGLGDVAGLLAGAALLLDYTIDIALFAVASTGYLNFFLPYLGIAPQRFVVALGPFQGVNLLWMGEALALILLVRRLNERGIRGATWVTEALGTVDLLLEVAIVALGFLLAWRPELLIQQWHFEFPAPDRFVYGLSLAIISFVGLESISQAAQETRRPAMVIPRTSLGLIFSIVVLVLGFSTVTLGIMPWQEMAARSSDPIAFLAQSIPYLGVVAGPLAAFMGATMLFISSNTGIMGASRLIFSMGHFRLASRWFSHVDPRSHTPRRAITGFSLASIAITVLAFLTPSVLGTLANIYAFGATFAYALVLISLVRLRYLDPYAPRAYRVPGNLRLRRRDGSTFDLPLLGILGLIGAVGIFVTVALTQEIGRLVGPAWMGLCFIFYLLYRRRNGLPLFGSIPYDWEKEQVEMLTRAEEYDLVEQYKQALIRRDRRAGVASRWEEVE